MKKKLSILVFILLLSGCANPLPVDRFDYVGEWRSSEMMLLILSDGTVSYKRKDGATTTSVNGPLKEFVGDDFVVGILFFTTTFIVSEPPYETEGVWKMTVDGVQLTKVAR